MAQLEKATRHMFSKFHFIFSIIVARCLVLFSVLVIAYEN